MKKLILKCILFIIMIITTFTILFFVATIGLGDQFGNAYNYVINDKYENLIKMKSPKIIFIAGSSGAFGINTDLIKKETGLECANLALHAGFGMKFQTEVSKGNITKGDIVIIAYEYPHWSGTSLSAELVVTGIDNNINLYKYVPKENYIDIIRYFPTYLFKKLDATFIAPIPTDGVYDRSTAFDRQGNLTLNRPICILPNVIDEKVYGDVTFNKLYISNDMIDYVNDFNEYVINKGATLLISFPPVIDEVVKSNNNEILEFQSSLDNKLNAPLISDINDYIYERKYFYDTIYHLNSEGETKRTKQFIQDLNRYLTNNN